MKVAIWGAGKMGEVHGRAYKKMGSKVEIAYIIEKDPQKAHFFSEEFHCTPLESIKDLEENRIDAIDICLPTCLHKEAVREALTVCSYIFCEKPVCLTKEEYDELRRMVEAKRCHLMVGQVLRFWSGYVEARELVLRGKIGIPRLITCLRRQKMPAWSKGNWLMDSTKSGGLLMDLCIHDIDYLSWLLGRPKTVACEIVKKEETTLHGVLNLSYEGCCANIIGSWGMPEGFNGGDLQASLEIVGDTGMITYMGGDFLDLIQGTESERIILKQEDSYEEELIYFVDCVRQHEEPSRSNLLSVEVTMRTLWAAQEAEKSGQCVKVNK